LLATLALVACEDGDDGDLGPTGSVGPAGADGANNERTTISLSLLGTAQNPAAEFNESAAEIVTFDPTSQNMFVANANSGEVDIFSLAAPASPIFLSSLDGAADVAGAVTAVAAASDLGAANSVDVHNASNTLAVALAADVVGDPSYTAFYQSTDGTFSSAVQVGFMPDMLTFTSDGSQMVVANEGEPNDDFSLDPVGSVSIIDMSGAYPAYLITRATPVDALKKSRKKGNRVGLFRSVMLGVQFTISIFMLAMVIVVYFQNTKVAESANMYPRSQVVMLERLGLESIQERFETLRSEWLKVDGIENVSFSSQVPDEQSNSSSGYALEPGNDDTLNSLMQVSIDGRFL
jgi:hypothetical protein